jgi:hypothetical protein
MQLDQIRDKEKKPPTAGGESARCQGEGADIGNGFNGRPGIVWPLFVQAPGQGRKAFFMQDLADSGRAEADVAILKDFADLVDRVVSLSQLDDSISGRSLTGSCRGTATRGGKETRLGVTAKLMAQDSKGPWAVAELASHHMGGVAIDEIGPHGFILALLGVRGLEEEVPACR